MNLLHFIERDDHASVICLMGKLSLNTKCCSYTCVPGLALAMIKSKFPFSFTTITISFINIWAYLYIY